MAKGFGMNLFTNPCQVDGSLDTSAYSRSIHVELQNLLGWLVCGGRIIAQ